MDIGKSDHHKDKIFALTMHLGNADFYSIGTTTFANHSSITLHFNSDEQRQAFTDAVAKAETTVFS